MKKIIILTAIMGLIGSLIACKEEKGPQMIPRHENVAMRPGDVAGSIALSVAALNQDAIIYYIITELNAENPTSAEVKAGADYRGQNVLRFGSATRRLFVTLEGFTEETYYMTHTVIEENGVFSEVVSRKVLTKNEFQAGLFGLGTEEDPYQINTVWQLELIATDEYGYTRDAHYIMTADIDLADGGYGPDANSWVPIGKQNGMNRKFSGVFDGNGYTIYNLHIDVDQGTEKWGLFQETDFDSVIMNVHLENVYVRASGFRIAGLIGYSKGIVYNVSVMNAHIEQTSGEGQVAAIIGAFYDTGTLFRAASDATVIATGRRVGGIVGAATTNSGHDTVTISDVSFTGTVTGHDTTARQYGGILGAGTGVVISRAFVDATISGVRQIGGIAGYMEGSGHVTGIVQSSVFIGELIRANGSDSHSPVAIGKILGDASVTKGPYELINNFAYELAVIETTGANSSRANNGIATPLLSFKSQTFYETQLTDWNFTSIWDIQLEQFPTLRFHRQQEVQA